MKKENTNHRILFLDYMRVLAFSLVILGHKFSKDLLVLSQDQSIHVTSRTLYEVLYNLSYGGAMGVVIFFLVSGYIITHVLKYESTLDFYVKRIFRIYPLYIFAVLLEAIIRSYHGTPFPPVEVMVPRLLLVGDFFGTPLSLAGVEWTLRIEIMFYFFMGLVKKSGLIKHGNMLSLVLVALTLALLVLPPLPISSDFHNAYFSTYTPFLFMGVIVYLLEKKSVSIMLGASCIIVMLFVHLNLIELYNKGWGRFNYAIIGMSIFIASWLLRGLMLPNYACLILSELTYAIYLFHNWAWSDLQHLVNRHGFNVIPESVQIMVLLISLCYVANKTVEKKGVYIGKLLTSKLSFRRKLRCEVL